MMIEKVEKEKIALFFWRDLRLLDDGFRLLSQAIRLGYDITVLMKAPSGNPAAWSEKVEWCHKNLLPYYPDKAIKIAIVEEKGLVYGRMLVDDWPPYVQSWLKWRPRGLVVMPSRKYNRSFSHPNVVRYGGEGDDDLVHEAMRNQAEGLWTPG